MKLRNIKWNLIYILEFKDIFEKNTIWIDILNRLEFIKILKLLLFFILKR